MILSICQQKDLSASAKDCKWVLDVARCFIQAQLGGNSCHNVDCTATRGRKYLWDLT